jgi:hypothetical protein
MSVTGNRPSGASSGANTAVSVTSSATKLATGHGSRICITVQPTNGDIYVGYDGTVTTATGMYVPSGTSFEERDFLGDLYAISSGTVDVRVAEAG